MNLPTVYIEREPFVNMVLASIETFKRECFGYVFGYKPNSRSNSFVITNVIAVQLAKKRKNTEIDQSKGSFDHMWECFNKYPHVYPLIGDFHSHPGWGKHHRSAEFSETDMNDMAKKNLGIGVVIKISSINKERILWESIPGGGVKGSLAGYKFHINVCRVVKDEGGNNVGECLPVDAHAAIKALNRALGYK